MSLPTGAGRIRLAETARRREAALQLSIPENARHDHMALHALIHTRLAHLDQGGLRGRHNLKMFTPFLKFIYKILKPYE